LSGGEADGAAGEGGRGEGGAGAGENVAYHLRFMKDINCVEQLSLLNVTRRNNLGAEFMIVPSNWSHLRDYFIQGECFAQHFVTTSSLTSVADLIQEII